MDSKKEKIEKEIKTALEGALNNVGNDYIIKALMEKTDSIEKIDKLYLERLEELSDEQRENSKLENEVKMMEDNISLQRDSKP